MVSVRLKDTGQFLDVDGTISFVKQVADMGDITKANSSCSWQLSFPKTPNNFKIFKGLGVAGSTSTTPYDKIVCELLYNGQTIEPNGNLIITETKGKDYKGYVKAGIIDFLQDVSNDKISDVIDLSDLSHENTVSNIIASFTAGLPYKYIVAYYNGSPLADNIGITNLNPFALVPSISIEYLWDAIFQHYGWTYSGNFDLTDTFMTYPNAVKYDETGATQVLQVDSFFHIINQENALVKQYDVPVFDPDYISYVSGSGNFTITESGNYKINAIAWGRSLYTTVGELPLYYRLNIIGQPEFPWLNADNQNETNITLTLQAGTNVRIEIKGALAFFNPPHNFIRNEIYRADINIFALGVETIDFSEALIKVKVKDFFKEIMVRNALTPFVDVENKAIRFRTLDERLSAPALNWSKKYIDVENKTADRSEKYVYYSYSQKNIISHKYNDPNVDWADGILLVDNANQPDEKNLYGSFTYAPDEGLIEYHGTNFPVYYVQNFRMFDVEVEEDTGSGELVAKYKQLKDRFYFIRSEQRIDDIYILGNLAEEFPLAIYSEVFSDIIDEKYVNMGQLINNAKILDIELSLSLVDVVMLDFYRRYYFEQEKAYFLMNRLTWKPKETSKAELIKINS